MAYTVREVSGLPKSPSARLIDRIRYPPAAAEHEIETEDVVTTTIDLWEVENNIGGFFSISYWRSLFNFETNYNITLHQNDPLDHKAHTFVLHESTDIEISQEAFEAVRSTMSPLVDNCTLLLTKGLLKEIITPFPVKASNLTHHLVKVMESHPDAHPDWVRVLQALTLNVIGRDDIGCGDTVVKLVDHGADITACDRKGNTVLHLACSGKSLRQVIKKTAEKMCDEERQCLLNQTNKEGKTALHTALQKDNPEVVEELMRAGADLSVVTEDEEGSNAFHVAAGSGNCKSIGRCHFNKHSFLKEECLDNPEKQRFLSSLNAFNKKGYTPLMMSTHIDSAVIFLQAGADPNIRHAETGNTVLHFTAEKDNPGLIRALIAFGADLEIKNRDNKTALDLASGKCAEVLRTTASKMKKASLQLSKATLEAASPPNSIFLLSMDGGGVRGLLHTHTLIAIQKRMREIQPDCSSIHKYFDYIAGTSIGGVVALCMVSADATLEATRAALCKAATEVFTQPITFPARLVDHSFRQICGNDTLLTDGAAPLPIIIPTVIANQSPPILHLVCNYGEARNGQRPPNEWKAWEVCRATSSAPFYFPPYEDRFVDGGVMANNPTLAAMTEIFNQAEREGKEMKIGLVVSLGTGVIPPTDREDVGVFLPNLNNAFQSLLNLPHTLSAVSNVLHLLISQASSSNGEVVEHAQTWCKSIGAPYYRLCVPFEKAIDFTESDLSVLSDMLYQCTLYLYDNMEEVDAIARLLLSRKPQ